MQLVPVDPVQPAARRLRVAVTGGTGFLGRAFAAAATEAGHDLVVLARSPERAAVLPDGVNVVQGSFDDPDALDPLVAGADVVVDLVAPPKARRHDSAGHALGVIHLVAAMQRHGVHRLVTIAGAAARVPGIRSGTMQNALHLLLGRIVMPSTIHTKDLEAATVAASGLDWTIVRPPRIGSARATGVVAVGLTELVGSRIDVQDAAGFLVRILDDETWYGTAPTLASRSAASPVVAYPAPTTG